MVLQASFLSVKITLHSKLEIYCIKIASEVPEKKTELVDISTPVISRIGKDYMIGLQKVT